MNKRHVYFLAGVAVLFGLFSALQGWAQSRTETEGPVITHAFAVEKGSYGFIWKIYLQAEDPHGEMLKIASVVDQPGYGRYPADWIYLNPRYQKGFKGYIQWNTFSSKATYLREWTEITLTVSIVDKAGNESNPVVFPFTFEAGIKDQYRYTLPAPFDEGHIPKLGNVFIDLYEPSLLGDSGSQEN